MGLKQEERLEMRSFKVGLVELGWYAVIDATKEGVFVTADGQTRLRRTRLRADP